MNIQEVSILSADAQSLIELLDQELTDEYAPEHRHTVDFEPFHRNGGIFVVGYDAELPVACGALRPISDLEVELKRMYVARQHRCRGVARRILGYLEDKSRLLGFTKLLLETGDKQHAAIAMYEKLGYQRIDAFGEYVNSPRSICFGKRLLG